MKTKQSKKKQTPKHTTHEIYSYKQAEYKI